MLHFSDSDGWSARVSARVPASPLRDSDSRAVAAMFGLDNPSGRDAPSAETLYEDFEVTIRPGEILAVLGPSGAGKSVLLREVARAHGRVRALRTAALSRDARPAVGVLEGGPLAAKLAALSRCGLADAHALVRPARQLSGGQLYRLALAEALHRAARAGRRGTLVLADEFAATLDDRTAEVLCRQVRKLITPQTGLSLLIATPRPALLRALCPDTVIVKPLGEPPRIEKRWAKGEERKAKRERRTGCDIGASPFRRAHTGSTAGASASKSAGPAAPAATRDRWTIDRGTIGDYHALAHFHYLAGPPAAHKRVYVIRPDSSPRRDPLDPPVAAVLVVSPPVPHVRGRNLALRGRYAGPDPATRRRLNREMECISRVVVHPVFRGCGLAVRLVRHALERRRTRYMESLAAMGAVHPMFSLAGMRAVQVPPDRHVARLVSAAQAVGISQTRLAAVAPVRHKLARGGGAARFLAREIDLCLRHSFEPKRRARLADPLAALCRRTARQYVYYVSDRGANT